MFVIYYIRVILSINCSFFLVYSLQESLIGHIFNEKYTEPTIYSSKYTQMFHCDDNTLVRITRTVYKILNA